ncbi:MAG: hypothetical protein QOI11_1154 [Candidatus Eremiobacteraeota bacterium]|nr:hypothetical protein [Candidatus Eremiobacteraeota bacterium]
MRRPGAALLLAAGLVCALRPPGAQAASGKINSFTTGSSGSIAFVVPSLVNPAQPGSRTYAYTLSIRTSPLPGSVTVSAPAITGTAGNSVPKAAFLASCSATSDPGGIFSSSGMVRLGAAAVTCATIAANANDTVNFTLTLYLDDTPDASSFTADTYASGTLSITANAP